MDRLGLPRTNILAYTMPGFATSDAHAGATRTQLMQALGVHGAGDRHPPELPCRCCADIGHPFADGEPVYDITFENVQAGERTSHLFRLANLHDGAGRRHRRPERAGARLVHLRRRRPDVALQRERPRAQDADPAPDPLGRRHAASSTRRPARCCTRSWTPRSAPSWCPRRRATAARPGAEHRGEDRALRAAGLQPLLHTALRLPAAARSRSWPTTPGATATRGAWPDGFPREQRHAVRPGRRSRSGCEVFLYRFFKTSQFKRSAHAQRRPRSARAARSRRAATGARRATPRRPSGSTSCAPTSPRSRVWPNTVSLAANERK